MGDDERELAKAILEALGLDPKGIKRLRIELSIDCPATVEIEREIDAPAIGRLADVFREAKAFGLTVGEMRKIKKGLD